GAGVAAEMRRVIPQGIAARIALACLVVVALAVAILGTGVLEVARMQFEQLMMKHGASAADANAMFEQTVSGIFAVAVVVAAVLSVVVAVLLARNIARPLEEVSNAANRLAGGDYRARAAEVGPAEIRSLATTFNAMADIVTTSRGTASRPFTVGTTGDFTLTAAPGTARAVAGDQTSVTLAAGGSGSFTSLVSLTVSTLARGITAGFSPSNLVAPGASAFVNVALASTVTPGSYGFTVSGQAQVDGRSVTRTAAFTLEVLAPDTTAITGRVLTAEAVPQPIPSVTVTVGSAFTLTDAGGNFVLLAPPPGQNMLLVDGRTASTATVQYPPVEVNIAV